jgi:hypothetical protein
LPLTFRVASFDLLRSDERARSLMSLQQPAKFEFAVRSNDSIRIDGQINCELAHCGELIALDKRSVKRNFENTYQTPESDL